MFFDFHFHGGKKLIMEAERLGYSGLAVVKYLDDYDKDFLNHIQELKEEFGGEQLDEASSEKGSSKHFHDSGHLHGNENSRNHSFRIYSGVEITAKNPEALKRKVQKFRKSADVVIVQGGDLKINRAACEDPRIDVLSQPYKNRRDSGMNHVLAKKAAENSVAVELNLKYLLRTNPKNRYRVLNQFRQIVKLQRKFNFPLLTTCAAGSIYDLRTPQDVTALSRCFGLTKEEAIETLSKTPMEIIKRGELRSSVIVNGVRTITT
ncbi:RNase P subunit p30 [anaerobic digester metagenome]